jgi:hypothetical protein
VAYSVSTARADYSMPSGAFLCRVLFQDQLTGASSDEFRPSVLGTITLDGRGGYVRREGGSGSVVAENGVIRFTSGAMQDIVAVWKRDPIGRSYLHIGGEPSVAPPSNPQPADFVCYQQ